MTRCSFCGLPFAGQPVVDSAEERGGTGGAAPRGYCCYGCLLTEKVLGAAPRPDAAPDGASTKLLVRFGIGAFFAMNVMTFSIAASTQYGWAEVHSASNRIGAMDWAMLALSIPVLVLQGLPILRHAAADLFARRLTLNLLFTIGIAASLAASAMSYARGAGPVYLETACMLLTLYTFGRWLDARAKSRVARTLTRLLESPATLHRRVAPDPGSVPAALLRVGDLVRIRPGDVFPVDGRIDEGRTFADESSLTGEAHPVAKGPGDEVFAGTLNRDGAPVVRVTATGDERRLARIERMIAEALARPTRAMRAADHVTARLIPVVAFAALAGFAAWLAIADFHTAVMNALSVLLIACPCALGLATPVVVWAALERAARQGILVRSGDVLETLARVRVFVFDKTGTLSDPLARDCAVSAAPGCGFSEDEIVRICASLETATRHPVAEFLIALADARGLEPFAVSDARTVPGRGVAGTIRADDGTRLHVVLGNAEMLAEEGIDMRAATAAPEARGGTVHLAVDGRWTATLHLRERFRDSLGDMTAALRAAGKRIEIITGDDDASADALRALPDVAVHAAMSPEDKVRFVRDVRARYGATAMLGDGLNDAAAIAEADVGMAMFPGARLANEAADVSFFNPDLRGVARLLAHADESSARIRANLVWAFAYNGVGVTLALAGLLHPLVSTVAMIGSSAFVTWNAKRIDD